MKLVSEPPRTETTPNSAENFNLFINYLIGLIILLIFIFIVLILWLFRQRIFPHHLCCFHSRSANLLDVSKDIKEQNITTDEMDKYNKIYDSSKSNWIGDSLPQEPVVSGSNGDFNGFIGSLVDNDRVSLQLHPYQDENITFCDIPQILHQHHIFPDVLLHSEPHNMQFHSQEHLNKIQEDLSWIAQKISTIERKLSSRNFKEPTKLIYEMKDEATQLNFTATEKIALPKRIKAMSIHQGKLYELCKEEREDNPKKNDNKTDNPLNFLPQSYLFKSDLNYKTIIAGSSDLQSRQKIQTTNSYFTRQSNSYSHESINEDGSFMGHQKPTSIVTTSNCSRGDLRFQQKSDCNIYSLKIPQNSFNSNSPSVNSIENLSKPNSVENEPKEEPEAEENLDSLTYSIDSSNVPHHVEQCPMTIQFKLSLDSD